MEKKIVKSLKKKINDNFIAWKILQRIYAKFLYNTEKRVQTNMQYPIRSVRNK